MTTIGACVCALDPSARYQREPALFEWFFGHTALRRIIRTYISKKKTVLHIGCGTSNLQEGMARSGYSIVNVRDDRCARVFQGIILFCFCVWH